MANFKCKKKQEGLNTVKAAINKVSHKKVVGSWTVSSDFEKLDKVKKLAVDVTAESYWRVDVLYV